MTVGMFIVELEPGVWLATWLGDPGRTLVLSSAKRYATKHGASTALGMARRYRPFPQAKVLQAIKQIRG